MNATALIWFGVAVVSALIAVTEKDSPALRFFNWFIVVGALVLGVAEVTS